MRVVRKQRLALLVAGLIILTSCTTPLEGSEDPGSPASPTAPPIDTAVPALPTTTPTIIPTVAPSYDELIEFLDQFNARLREPNFAASVQSLMSSEFGYGLWRAEWQILAPENAVQNIASLFEDSPHYTLQLMADEPSTLLDGQNPYQMLGLEKTVTAVEFAQGLGTDQRGEAFLFFTSQAGRTVWEAVLVAPDGFQPAHANIVPPVGLIYRISGDGLWVIDEDLQPQRLGEAEGLPSPTLSYAAYPDFEAGSGLVSIVDLGEGSQRTIELPGRLVGCFAWQSETHVLCSIRFEGEEDAPNLGHLTRIGVVDGTVEVIERERWLFSPPAISPDGRIIAFDGGGQESFLWQDGAVEPFEHTSFAGLPEGGLRSISSPSYSPDGTHIAWFVGTNTGSAIAIFDLAARTVKLLHEFEPIGFGGWFPPVAWSPDSRWLAAQLLAYPPEQEGLWLIAADGSRELRLGDRTMQSPLWLSDVTLLYTNAADGKLSTIEQYDLVSDQRVTLSIREGAFLVGLHRWQPE